jgi:ribosomal protein S18 acetylase RimI-like enzyme
MTEAFRAPVTAAAAQRFAIAALRDRKHIRALLEARRPYAAYALGQLEPALFRRTEWWRAEGDAGDALLLHSRGGLGNALFAMGETAALDALLAVHPGPRQTFLTCEVHHLAVVERHFLLEQRQTMIRMHVTRETFRPHAGGGLRRLAAPDARAVNALYRSDGVNSYYTGAQIEAGVYYGAERDERLVSIAGTHVLSFASGIAVVGNVYTHPRYRGARLAQATTGAVAAELLGRCDDVVLSVDPSNVAAVRAYERLGFREVARLIEGAAVRRDITGFATFVRRLAARARGRDTGNEIVWRNGDEWEGRRR